MVFDLDFERLIAVEMTEEYEKRVQFLRRHKRISREEKRCSFYEMDLRSFDHSNVYQYLFDHVMLSYRIDGKSPLVLMIHHSMIYSRDKHHFSMDQM